MPWTSEHLKWLENTGEKLLTSDGKIVEVWEFNYEEDEKILSGWAKHFRNHYCLDSEIDYFRRGYGCSRSKYLNTIKFPDPSAAPGPSIRAGDFGEVLVADYLEYILNFWVPRTRYGDKTIRNESTKGCDIIGFKILEAGKDSRQDTLAVFETKAQFSGNTANPRLQDAIDDSIKDIIRKGESLNAIKQRMFDKQMLQQAEHIERFQNSEDRPYNEVSGAVALFSTNLFDRDKVLETNTNVHPNQNKLKLLVIHGKSMMDIVHVLYRRAADEA